MDTSNLVIHAKWVIPVEPLGEIHENAALVIENQTIKEIIPSKQAEEKYSVVNHIHRLNHAILPGFINAHTHTPMCLLRGYADDLSLMKWLKEYIWPVEQKMLSESFVYDGAMLAITEMIKSGVTCFNDMYFYPHKIIEAANKTGIKSIVGLAVMNIPTPWASNEKEYFSKMQELLKSQLSSSLTSFSIAPHSVYTVSETSLVKTFEIAEEYDLSIHMHVQETADEVKQCIAQTKLRPLERLSKLNIVNDRLIAVHMTQTNDSDIHILKKAKAHVVHCPESNLKLASGFCPVHWFLSENINVALGTDGAASNNNLDMLEEMHTAAILAKAQSNNPCALKAAQSLQMATLNGAKALRIEAQTGSLLPGKQADLIAIDLSHPACQPVYNPISQIVYTASRSQISDVWVQGKQLLSDHQLTTIDELEVIAKAKEWANRIVK